METTVATETKQEQKRPFHETIVEAIGKISHSDSLRSLSYEADGIFWLIMHTVIPANHDQIVEAIDLRFDGKPLFPYCLCKIDEVKASVLEQKKEAE